jgi:hypothetical protein
MYKDKLKWKCLKKSYRNTCLLWWGGVWLDEQKKNIKVTGYKVIIIHNVNEKWPIIGSMMSLNGMELLWWISLWWPKVSIYYKCIMWYVNWLEVVEWIEKKKYLFHVC